MDELGFRLLLVFLVGILGGIQFSARYVAHKNRPKHSSEPFRSFLETSVNVVCAIWAMTLCLYVVFGASVPFTVSLFLRWIGIALTALCIPLSVWVYTELGRQFSSKLQLLRDHELVQSGPYRYVRHPMYATLFLCVVATTLASANLIVGISGALVIIVIAARIRKEEAMMVERFGRDYEAYRQRAGALFPKLF